MSLVEKLSKKPEPPTWAKTLRQFQVVPLAEHLGISPGWMSMVLLGTRPASKKLEEKILVLVKEIEAEQRR